jgi:uncharacterized delta-60 repeat protein
MTELGCGFGCEPVEPRSDSSLAREIAAGGEPTPGCRFASLSQEARVSDRCYMETSFTRLAVAAVAAVAFAAGTSAAEAAPGALDPTFGSAGIVLTDPGVVGTEGLKVQPDGKVLALDSGFDPYLFQRVRRFLPDGTPDPSFGNNGVAEPVAAPNVWSHVLALQPDGKIVIAGYDGAGDFVVARVMPDGKLDPDFDGDTGNGNGIVHTPLTPSSDRAYAVAIDKQGRIVVAGTAAGDVAIARYLPDGKLDHSLAGDGTLIDVTPAIENVSAMATLDDGIIVAGAVGGDPFVARYTEQGAVASGFGTLGRKVLTADAGDHDWPASLMVQADGTIVLGVSVVGQTVDPPDRLVALTPGGGLDTGFANGGSVAVQISVNSIALAADDTIVAAGYGQLDGDAAFAVERRHADGMPDPSFGSGGVAMTRPPGTANGAVDYIAFAPDGKPVISGLFYDAELQNHKLTIARYQVDPDPVSAGSADPAANAQPAATTAQQPGPLSLSSLKLTNRTFAVGRRSTAKLGQAQTARSRKRGTAFVFSLNRAATVTIRIKRLRHADKVLKLKRLSNAGRNRVGFSGRVGRHALRPGRYRATLTATDTAGSRSKAQAITFRLVRR